MNDQSAEKRDSLNKVVDRLLKQLPGADPTLRGDPASHPTTTSSGPRPRVPPVLGGVRAAGRRTPAVRQVAALWGVALLGVVAGFGMLGWPYAHRCGFPLIAYLTGVTAVLLLGGWTALTAWRYRVGAVHLVALILTFWGIVLAAEQVLPRIGYANQTATWWCSE